MRQNNTRSKKRSQRTKRSTPKEFSQRYVKHRTLGSGSMGVVIECYDRKQGQYVACKSVRPNAPERHRSILLSEANLLASLDHPNILPVYDQGDLFDGRPYYTMKRVHGHTLEDEMKQETFDLRRGIETLLQVCDALSYTHAQGVVHLDLKPGNILRDHRGRVFVIDWGTSEARVDSSQAPTTQQKKGKYIVNGTPLYIAPEVLRGERACPRADQYAIGVILYEMLTGCYPFYNDNIFELFRMACCTMPPQPSLRAPQRHTPPALEQICLRLLSKAADRRFRDCLDLNQALNHWLTKQSLNTQAEARHPRWFEAPA